MKTPNLIQSADQFDQIVTSRLFASDFAQPPVHDFDYYKSKSTAQIQSAIQCISSANTAFEFNTAIAQTNAFIDAALSYEFISLAEKAMWLDKAAHAIRAQLMESANE